MKPIITLCFVLLFQASVSVAERIKDITTVAGVRSNQLVGYGLVVGLDGSGDKSPFTNQTFITVSYTHLTLPTTPYV